MRRGDKIANRYVLDQQLGGGTFGTTFAAYDMRSGRRVALKFQHSRTFESTAGFESSKIGFSEEADLLETYNGSPGIPEYFGLERYGEGWFIVMEMVNGMTLNEYTDAGNSPMDQDIAVSIVVQVAETISVLHETGHVHRDIKPSNTMIDHSGNVYVIDFGSTWTAGHVPSLLEGTAGFAAPEQAISVEIGTSADVFSMGCMLVKFLALHLPYQEDYLTHAREAKRPPPQPDLTHVPTHLVPTVSDMIRWDPRLRIQTATEVVNHLRPFLPAAGSSPNPKLVGADPTARYRRPAAVR